MKLSSERILTTHVGSLPRPDDVSKFFLQKENDETYDQAGFDACMADAVSEVVGHQVKAGIDIVSYGEMSKISYATYIKDRYHGFSGESPRRIPGDLQLYSNNVKKIAEQGQAPKLTRPMCTGKIDPDICCAKLNALAEGSAIASKRLW